MALRFIGCHSLQGFQMSLIMRPARLCAGGKMAAYQWLHEYGDLARRRFRFESCPVGDHVPAAYMSVPLPHLTLGRDMGGPSQPVLKGRKTVRCKHTMPQPFLRFNRPCRWTIWCRVRQPRQDAIWCMTWRLHQLMWSSTFFPEHAPHHEGIRHRTDRLRRSPLHMPPKMSHRSSDAIAM